MSNIINVVDEFLHQNIDSEYQKFSATLIPNIEASSILGVRIPLLRELAKTLCKRDDLQVFFDSLPHKYHEENMLHAILLSKIKDYDQAIEKLNEFLPHVTNWAVCDTILVKVLAKNSDRFKLQAAIWLASNHDYMIRFAIISYMKYCLNDNFEVKDLSTIANIQSDEYYVNMARAWYFATALAFHYDETLKLIESKTLDTFTHNKSIQKAKESFRVSDEHKIELNSLKK